MPYRNLRRSPYSRHNPVRFYSFFDPVRNVLAPLLAFFIIGAIALYNNPSMPYAEERKWLIIGLGIACLLITVHLRRFYRKNESLKKTYHIHLKDGAEENSKTDDDNR